MSCASPLSSVTSIHSLNTIRSNSPPDALGGTITILLFKEAPTMSYNHSKKHYSNGRYTGQTDFYSGFTGNHSKHYSSSGKYSGSTYYNQGFFGNRADHYDSSGRKTGSSYRERTLFGGTKVTYYNKNGKKRTVYK